MAQMATKLKTVPEIDRHTAQARMLETIKEIKADRGRYEELRDALKSKATDEERAEVLVDFITRHDDLVKALPSGEREVALITTVTITTVFIFAGSAY